MPRRTPEEYSLYRKQYRQTETGKIATTKANKKWQEKNKEKYYSMIRDWQSSHKGQVRENAIKSNKKYRNNPNNHIKIVAKKAVQYAIKTGRLKRKPCEMCGEVKVVGHHSDYKDKLNVQWLCHKCHYGVHKVLLRKSGV